MSHDFTEVEQFFDQWSIYQQVIDKDIMNHKSIHKCIHDVLQKKFKTKSFSVLDLACGNATCVANTLQHYDISYYHGVDLSSVALAAAKNNIGKCNFSCSFSKNDFFQFIQQTREKFDVVIVGYALHHLDKNHKDLFFQYIRKIINKDGLLILFDLLKKTTESKSQFSQRNYDYTAKKLSDDVQESDLELIKKHIMDQDFPETLETLCEFARKRGFKKAELLFQDSEELFGLICCTT